MEGIWVERGKLERLQELKDLEETTRRKIAEARRILVQPDLAAFGVWIPHSSKQT